MHEDGWGIQLVWTTDVLMAWQCKQNQQKLILEGQWLWWKSPHIASVEIWQLHQCVATEDNRGEIQFYFLPGESVSLQYRGLWIIKPWLLP